MLLRRIQNFAHQQELWQPNAKLLVAVSGGADSSCLLHILSRLAPKYDLELHIAHVNYGLRKEDSQKDELFVRKLATKYQLPLTVFSFKKAPDKKYSEDELRSTRYAFFEQLREELGFDFIALAHNQDDQAETVLLRLLRGAGLAGLAAMKAKNSHLVRPLLQTSRSEIKAYLKKNSLSFRTDKSNRQNIFTRNKVRNSLLPYLEKHFNPKLKEKLSLTSLVIADDYAYLEDRAKAVLDFSRTADGLVFKASWLTALPAALQRNCLRLLILELKSGLTGIEAGHIEEILKALKSRKGKQQKISFQGLNITRKGDNVYMLLG